MKFYLTFLILATLMIARAQDPVATYSTRPNTSGYPFPSAFPVVEAGKADQFDWKRYMDEAVSEGDKVFRMNQAFRHGIETIDYNLNGAMESNSDEAARNRIAAEEVSKACELIEELYRMRLKENDPEVLATLEEFIASHRTAIRAYIDLVGGGWEGSGARVAYSSARLDAFVRYRASLLSLRSSLYLQDLPQIAFPIPSLWGTNIVDLDTVRPVLALNLTYEVARARLGPMWGPVISRTSIYPVWGLKDGHTLNTAFELMAPHRLQWAVVRNEKGELVERIVADQRRATKAATPISAGAPEPR